MQLGSTFENPLVYRSKRLIISDSVNTSATKTDFVPRPYMLFECGLCTGGTLLLVLYAAWLWQDYEVLCCLGYTAVAGLFGSSTEDMIRQVSSRFSLACPPMNTR